MNLRKAISDLDKAKCSGCGVCGYICPASAISFIDDSEGYRVPAIDTSKCIGCGKCITYCHLQSQDLNIPNNGILQHYAVKHSDDIRKKSRSGGVFVAISDYVLSQGGIIFGAAMDQGFSVFHTSAVNALQRDLFCGSKYVQSNTEGVYAELDYLLNKGKCVLYTGTPCQIAAVARIFDPRKYSNLYLLDFICHGVPSPGLWKDYINWVEHHYKMHLVDIDFRDKDKYSWESHVQRLEFEYKTTWSRRYTNLFTSSLCLRESCYVCPYAKVERVSDFTMGDFWGIDEINKEFNDGKGISLLILRTQKALELFERIKGDIEYIETSDYELGHYNLKRPTKRPSNRNEFVETYKSKGFEYCSNKYGRYDLIHRIKYRIIDHMD